MYARRRAVDFAKAGPGSKQTNGAKAGPH